MTIPHNSRYPDFTVGGLCSGIGGLELGLERAGMRTIWQSETDPYASKVLAKHWPDVPNLGDLTAVDWSSVVRPDLVCGGFPCQPFSHAGSRKGADDSRHLWPHIAACLRVVRPEWVLLENVPGLLTLGFGQVAADLAAVGYDIEWECIPAAAVGAPHLRYRIFIVAHTDQFGLERLAGRPVPESWHVSPGAQGRSGQPSCSSNSGVVAYADGEHAVTVDAEMGRAPQPVADTALAGLEGTGVCGRSAKCGTDVADADQERPSDPHNPRGREPDAIGRGDRSSTPRCGTPRDVADADRTARRPARRASETVFRSGTLERPGRCSCCDRDHWESEPDVGRVAHGIPHRVDRLRCLGNAVVPQVAELVGRMILEAAS